MSLNSRYIVKMSKKFLTSCALVVGTFGLSMTMSGATTSATNTAPAPVCDGATCTVTADYSSHPIYHWVAPAGVTSITFDVRGADGGLSTGQGRGGRGGRITGSLQVTPGTTYYFIVGAKGRNNAGPQGATPKGGFNGGGGGVINYPGDYPGMGGGASSIQTTNSIHLQKSQLSQLLVTAGGGGGAGYRIDGGDGGGDVGGGVNGGTQSAGGVAGGSGATAGKFDQGGSGFGWNSGGGGGGGGFYGGGGGYGSNQAGGGSSYADPMLATVELNTQGYVDNTRNGTIIISYANPN